MYEIYLKLLAEKGVKTSDVCKETGIVASTFSDWKKGKSTPKQDKLIKIADYFGVSLEYLMTGKEPEINFDYIYTDGNSEFLVEVSKKAKDKDFVERMMKYMSLLSEDKKSVDDMIDFLHAKEHQGED